MYEVRTLASSGDMKKEGCQYIITHRKANPIQLGSSIRRLAPAPSFIGKTKRLEGAASPIAVVRCIRVRCNEPVHSNAF